ncbi:MFS transporter [Scopulibacillus cellulosilyticus]|uniref:MFS transporter n=1 Tax=Scopulibacillus cellulosilyticus TaxID=2665665 RepID=A0ABW2PPY1_9BACL
MKIGLKRKINDQIVIFTAGIGLFLSTLDTGIINVALPALAQTFHSSISVISWTVTLYTLVLTGTIIIFGRLSDNVGRLKVYSLGLIVFLLASILCSLSHSPGQLILFRAIQGIGAAMLQATAAAIITTTIPKERIGSALGTLGMLIAAGPVLGPSLGGLLISIGSWRWIFLINVPISVIGLSGCVLIRKKVKELRNNFKLDLIGNILLSVSILFILWGLSIWPIKGLLSFYTVIPFVVFIILFTAFIIWEIHTRHPIIDLRLFRCGSLSASILAVLIFGGATSLGFIVPPYFLEHVKHLLPWQTGIVNLSAPMALVIFSKVSGQLIKKVQTTHLMITGILIMASAYGTLGGMEVNWSPFLISGILFIYGIGAGLFQPPNTAAIMGAVPYEIQGTIGAVQRMVQNLGIALYTVIATALIQGHSHNGINDLMNGYQGAWIFAAITLVLSLLTFVFVFIRCQVKSI